MSDEESIKIKYFGKVDETRLNPIIMTFPSNFPKQELIDNENPSINWTLCENKSHYVKDDKLLVGDSEKLFFEGKSRRKEKMSSDFVIGVFSKKKRMMNLLDFDALFVMNQKIKNIESKPAATEEITDTNVKQPLDKDKQAEYLDKKEQLVKDFGTNKSKKLINNRRTNIVKEENISSTSAMHNILKKSAKNLEHDYKQNKETLMHQREQFMKQILPVFDLQATDVQNVYNIGSILEKDEAMEININDIMRVLKSQEGLENVRNNYSEFVFDHLKVLADELSKGKKVDLKLRYLVYLDYMIKFYGFNKIEFKSPEDIARILGINLYFVNILLNKFCETFLSIENTIQFKKTSVCKHRLICYIIVLALSLKKYKFDIKLLAKSLKLEIKAIYEYLKEVGCVFSDMKTEVDENARKIKKFDSMMVELKAPLKLNVDYRGLNIKN